MTSSDRNAQSPVNAGVIAPPPLLALGALLIGIVLSYLLPSAVLAALSAPVRWGVGGILIVGAAALLLTAAGLFKRAGTSVKPWESSTALVTTGLYRYTRNPMYVGFLLLSFGIAFVGAYDVVVLTTLLLWLVLHVGVIKREEAYLVQLFGDEYTAYKARTPRYGLFL